MGLAEVVALWRGGRGVGSMNGGMYSMLLGRETNEQDLMGS